MTWSALNSTTSSVSDGAAAGGGASAARRWCRRGAWAEATAGSQRERERRPPDKSLTQKVRPAARPCFNEPSLLHLGRRSTIRLAWRGLCHCGGRVLRGAQSTDRLSRISLDEDPFRRQPAHGRFCARASRSAGKNRIALDSLGADRTAVDAALRSPAVRRGCRKRRRAVRPADGGVRRLLVVGTGDGTAPSEAAEKLGGALVARLLTSGETQAVIDLTGLNYDADAAARRRAWPPRCGRGATTATGRSSRTSRSRRWTKSTIVGARRDAASSWEAALAAGLRRRRLHPRAGHRAGEHHLPRDASSSACRARSKGTRRRIRGPGRRGDAQARHGRAARRRAGLRPRRRGC